MDTQSIWKSSALLADGREIIYFDEAPGLGRAQAPDTRPLGPRTPGPALPTGRHEWGTRWDPLAGEWVVIAAARQDRTFLPPADECPLDPSKPGHPTEIPASSYDVVVFENRFGSWASRAAFCPRRPRLPSALTWPSRSETRAISDAAKNPPMQMMIRTTMICRTTLLIDSR